MSSITTLPAAGRYVDRTAIEKAQKALVGAVRALFEADIFSASGHGNASIRLAHNPQRILLTAPGVLRGMRDDEVAEVDLDGTVISGELSKESADVIRMHTECYRRRPDVNAVIHTHSPYATAFAVAARPLPLTYEPLAGAGQSHEIPVAPYGKRGEPASIKTIADTLEAYPTTTALLLANHGVLVLAKDIGQLVRIAVAVEEAAKLQVIASAIGGAVAFPLPHAKSAGAV
jgi:L-ribulose-5-phosphate 4-epimerase